MKKYNFHYNVRLDDLDYMGIVGNANWLIFLERARIDLLNEINFPFSKMLEQKIGGVVAEANLKFLKPAFFNDQLTIEVLPHHPFSKGFNLQYTIKNQTELECLQAEITIVFVDEKGKSTNIPKDIKNKIFDL